MTYDLSLYRFKNYMIAMVNKNLLPLRYKLPFVGDVIFFSQGLKYNVEMLLFCTSYITFAAIKINTQSKLRQGRLAGFLLLHFLFTFRGSVGTI